MKPTFMDDVRSLLKELADSQPNGNGTFYAAHELLARWDSEAPSIRLPTGWMLVPLRMSDDMIEGFDVAMQSGHDTQHIWNTLLAVAPRAPIAHQSLPSERAPIDLGPYVNAASISAADVPHVVVEKLQRAINAHRQGNEHGKK